MPTTCAGCHGPLDGTLVICATCIDAAGPRLDGYSNAILTSAVKLIEAGTIVRAVDTFYWVPSSDGTRHYLASATYCECAAYPRRCKHRAVAIVISPRTHTLEAR